MPLLTAFFCRLTGLMLTAGLALISPAHAAVHVLLIGVNDYSKSSGLLDLGGPPNDIALMKDVLIHRFDVSPANITTLLNPTHTAIETAFAGLAARVRADDHVYIHYSGHGSWATAPPPKPGEQAERRGQDQTWVPYGARSPRRTGKDAMDVLDKELALWLDPLYRLTPNVVFVSDSCHSATVTRDDQRGVRSVDGTAQVHPLRATIQRVPPPTTGLRIGAARDFESAVELDPRVNGRCSDKTHCYGVFTWNWAAALQSSRPGESWGDVFNRATAAIVATPGVMQRPQKEGIDDRAVFDGKFASLTALVPITEVRASGSVTLGAGLLSGLTSGSELEVVQGDAVARLCVTSASAGTAEATVLAGKPKAGQVARVVKHEFTDHPIRLFVGNMDAADESSAKQVRHAVDVARGSALQGFALVPQRTDADMRLEILRPQPAALALAGARPLTEPCRSDPCAPAEVWLLSRQGQLVDASMRFSLANQAEEMPRMISNLAKMGHASEVRGIGGQGNATPLQVQISVLRPPAGDERRCPDGIKEGSGWQRMAPVAFAALQSAEVRPRDCLAFTLDNRDPQKTWYGYVVAIESNFNIEPVWPPVTAIEDDARMEPHTSFHVVDSLYRVTSGRRETLLFVVSESPVPIVGLMQQGLKSAATRGSSPSLTALLAPSALTRGTESAIGTWGAQSLDLDVPDLNP